jgi:hypothetical protein
MNSLLTQKSLSLFTAVGGWRTFAEAVVSQALFVLAYVLTGQVLTSALIAVGAVAVFAVFRVFTDRKYWQAAVGLVIVAVSALLAGSSGQAVDFYLPDIVAPVVVGAVFLVSMLVGWPVIGLVVGGARGERLAWRRDRARRRRYQACTAVFVAKFGITLAVLVPLYRAEQLVALGITSTLLATPAMGVCAYICWRILRAERATTALDGRRG